VQSQVVFAAFRKNPFAQPLPTLFVQPCEKNTSFVYIQTNETGTNLLLSQTGIALDGATMLAKPSRPRPTT